MKDDQRAKPAPDHGQPRRPTPDAALESWRPVPGWPAYEVSDHSRVRSYWTAGHGRRIGKVPQRVLRGFLDQDGVPSVTLCNGHGRRKIMPVAQFVEQIWGWQPRSDAVIETTTSAGVANPPPPAASEGWSRVVAEIFESLRRNESAWRYVPEPLGSQRPAEVDDEDEDPDEPYLNLSRPWLRERRDD